MRSFIKPRKKKLVDDMTSLWIVFIIFVAIGLIVFGVIVNYKSSFYIKMLENLSQQNSSYSKTTNAMKQQLELIDMQVKLSKEVKETNVILKESIKNLFDLIPDQVTLTHVVMDRDSLLLKGYTRSPDTYKLLLEPPLKSIFTSSVVKFEKGKNGHVVFESLNTMESHESQKSQEPAPTQIKDEDE